VDVTINYFRWVKTEKSRNRHEARCSASNVDKIYNLAILLPGLGRESHPTSDLQTELVRVNPGVNR